MNADLPWTADTLLESLVRFPSVSNTSNREITQWVADRLTQLDFAVEWQDYTDASGTTKCNVVARREPAASGSASKSGLAYFAHTDVVPANDWQGPADVNGHGEPFSAVRADDRIYGRGSCDMKGSLACMLAAASRIRPSDQVAPLTIVCTADEEVGFEGARRVAAHSPGFSRLVDEQPLGIVGEPTMLRVVHAHKGIAGYTFTSRGRAAHSSSREGINANLAIVPLLVELKRLNDQCETDETLHNNQFDPPTLSWNFGVSDQMTAVNITPPLSRAWLCFRTMPDVDHESIVQPLLEYATSLGLTVTPGHGGPPLWVDPHSECIQQMCRLAECDSAETVCYSTDGGQFTQLKHLLVMGPGDIAQAHTADEWISLSQLQAGTDVYAAAIRHWCG